MTFVVSAPRTRATSCHYGKAQTGKPSVVNWNRVQKRERKLAWSSRRKRNLWSRWRAVSSCRWEDILHQSIRYVTSKRKIEIVSLRKCRIISQTRLELPCNGTYEEWCEHYLKRITCLCSNGSVQMYPNCQIRWNGKSVEQGEATRANC